MDISGDVVRWMSYQDNGQMDYGKMNKRTFRIALLTIMIVHFTDDSCPMYDCHRMLGVPTD